MDCTNHFSDLVASLHRLGAANKQAFYKNQTGRSLRVLFEEREVSGLYAGWSDNYVRIAVASEEDLANRLGTVRVRDTVASGKSIVASAELIEIENSAIPIAAHADFAISK